MVIVFRYMLTALLLFCAPVSVVAETSESQIILPTPQSSVEMQQVWAFAHPSNKAMTGPLARFARLFDMPAYRPLLGHKSHEILKLAETEAYVQLRVQITASNSQSYVYLWVLGRAMSGQEAGSWMTLSVSAPAGGGTQS